MENPASSYEDMGYFVEDVPDSRVWPEIAPKSNCNIDLLIAAAELEEAV